MMKVKNYILHIGLTLLGIMIPFGSLHANDAEGYPMQTVQWGEVTATQRSVIERLMADLTLVPASDDTHAVWMGRYEVTQNAWRAVTGDSTRWDALAGDSLPAHTLSWNEAKQFIMALRHLTGKHFRMPTLQEWQFAAKGGQTYPYAGSDKLDEVGWYKDNCNYIIHGVGQKRPNGYGLYDMCGNAPEWCAPTDGATLMPLCGGGYWMDEAQCTVDAVSEQTSASATGGLRLVLDPINEAEQRVLVVTQADGSQEQFPLSQQPKVTIESSNLYVDVNGEKHEYDLKQMARMHYVKAATAARAKAPEEPIDVEGRLGAIYTFRNDSSFNAFLNMDVDSIVYSRISVDNIEYNAAVTQEVWTPDSVYRIPLAAVDSIGFHQPKPILRNDLVFLGEYYALHTNSVNGLTLEFDRFIDADSIPAIGQVLVSRYEGEPFGADGFVGKVKEMKTTTNGTLVVCEEAGLADIFKQLVVVGKSITSDDEDVANARRRAWSNEPLINISSEMKPQKIELPEAWRDEMGNQTLKLEIGSLLTIKSKNPDIVCRYYAHVNEFKYFLSADVFITHNDLTYSLEITSETLNKLGKDGAALYKVLTSDEGIDGWIASLDKEKEEDPEKEKDLFDAVKDLKVSIPLVVAPPFKLEMEIAPILKKKGSVGYVTEIKTTAKQHIGFKTEGWNALLKYSPLSPITGFSKQASFSTGEEMVESMDIKASGSLSVGMAVELVASLVSSKLVHVQVGAECGRKLSGEFKFRLIDSENDDLNVYDRIKDTNVKVNNYAKVKGEIGITPSDFMAMKGEWQFYDGDVLKYYLVPHFSDPAFPGYYDEPDDNDVITVGDGDGGSAWSRMKSGSGSVFDGEDGFTPGGGAGGGGGQGWDFIPWGGLSPKSLYTTPSKDVLFPCKIGMRIENADGQKVKEVKDVERYRLEEKQKEHRMGIDVSDLPPGENYTCYPTYGWWGDSLFTAGPRVKFSIPKEMTLSKESLALNIGESDTVVIQNGWKDYVVGLDGQDVVTVRSKSKSRDLIVKAVGQGNTTLKVTDRRDGKTIEVPITVTTATGEEQQPLEPIPENTYAMKYWFDDQKELAGTIENLAAIQELDVSGLSDGLHALHVTVCEDFEYLGHYETAPQTVYFIKEGQKTDIVYDYYVDGKKIMDSNTKTANTLTSYLPMQTIDEGLHRLTTVATLTGTDRTTVHNNFFVRANNNNEEAGMRLTVSIDDGTPTTLKCAPVDGSVSYDLDIKGLEPGLHRLNYQIASNGTKGVNTPPRTAFFLVDQKLDGYEYLLNGDETTTVKVAGLHADSPYELVTDLSVQPMPVRSSKFHFAVENGEPCVYGITDLNMRINDEYGAHTDGIVEFIDVNVRQPLQNVTTLEKNIPAEVGAPGENVIRWFSLYAHRGDGICLEASHPCTLQLFAPDGEELYSVSGIDATVTGEVNGQLTGTYYVALHDMSNADDESVTLTWNDGNSILTQPVIASPGSNIVYKGTELKLSSATQDADIWYSTDGSRPMPESSRTHKYESPFVINDEMVLRAIATNKDMLVSDETGYRISIARLDRQQQLMKGWNWVSANSTSGDPMDVMTFLQPLEGSVQRMLSQTEEIINDPLYGMIGNLQEVNTLEGYNLQLTEDRTYSWTGIASLPSLRPLQLYKGWNWIGFLPALPMTPDMAFGDFTPTEGDYVVGKTGFSTYTDGLWKGTLTSMMPGHAYHYYSDVTTPMTYTNELPNDDSVTRQARASLPDRHPWQYDIYTYPDVTPVIARLESDGVLTSTADYMVGAFCGDECRGVGCLVDGLLFISVYASAAEMSLINFRAFDNMTEQEIAIDGYLVADGQLHGSINQPLILHAISGTPSSTASLTAGQGRTFDVYSLTGILVRRNATSLKGLKPGVYIINGQKVRL